LVGLLVGWSTVLKLKTQLKILRPVKN